MSKTITITSNGYSFLFDQAKPMIGPLPAYVKDLFDDKRHTEHNWDDTDPFDMARIVQYTLTGEWTGRWTQARCNTFGTAHFETGTTLSSILGAAIRDDKAQLDHDIDHEQSLSVFEILSRFYGSVRNIDIPELEKQIVARIVQEAEQNLPECEHVFEMILRTIDDAEKKGEEVDNLKTAAVDIASMATSSGPTDTFGPSPNAWLYQSMITSKIDKFLGLKFWKELSLRQTATISKLVTNGTPQYTAMKQQVNPWIIDVDED